MLFHFGCVFIFLDIVFFRQKPFQTYSNILNAHSKQTNTKKKHVISHVFCIFLVLLCPLGANTRCKTVWNNTNIAQQVDQKVLEITSSLGKLFGEMQGFIDFSRFMFMYLILSIIFFKVFHVTCFLFKTPS